MRLLTISDFDSAKASGAVSLLHSGRAAELYLGGPTVGFGRILYKEFASRSFWDKPKAILFGSRARRAWRAQQFLTGFGFLVPKAFDVIEAATCLVPERSVLVMGYKENAVSLRQFLPTAGPKQRQEVLCLLAKEVACMHNFGIAHDDMNLGNVLLCSEASGQPTLVWTDIERIKRSFTGRFSLSSSQVTKNLRQLRKIEVGLKCSEKRFFLRCYIKQLGATKRQVRKALATIVKSGVY